MNAAQQAAAEAAVDAWAAPQIAAASIFERGAIQAYLDQHKAELIQVIGNAVLSVPSDPPAS